MLGFRKMLAAPLVRARPCRLIPKQSSCFRQSQTRTGVHFCPTATRQSANCRCVDARKSRHPHSLVSVVTMHTTDTDSVTCQCHATATSSISFTASPQAARKEGSQFSFPLSLSVCQSVSSHLISCTSHSHLKQ